MNPYLMEDVSKHIVRSKYAGVLHQYCDIGSLVSKCGDRIRRYPIIEKISDHGNFEIMVTIEKTISGRKYNVPYGFRNLERMRRRSCPSEERISRFVNRICRKMEINIPYNYIFTYPTSEDLLKVLPEDWRFGNYNFYGKLKRQI